MATNSFKIRKSINIEPIDPTSVTNPEAGDIIIDSTDENTLKLFNPDAGEFETISGGGGQSSTLMSDFEKLTPTVSNVVAVAETVTFLPIDDNKKSVKATFSGSNGTIRYEVPVTADLEGVQGVVTLWIKTSLNNLSVVATKDGVAQNNGLTVNSSNKWRQYEVPVVFGAADYGFEVRASGAVAGDVFIDEAFVKVDSSMFARVNTAMTDWTDFTPSFTGFTLGNGTINFSKYRRDGSEALIKMRVTLGSTSSMTGPLKMDSIYPIRSDFFLNEPTHTVGLATFEDSGAALYHGRAQFIDNINTITIYTTTSNLSYTGSSGVSSTVPMTWTTSDAFEVDIRFPVENWLVETSNIVTQNTELTAKTANEFVAKITAPTTIVSQNFDWITSCSQNAAGVGHVDCVIPSGVFDVAPLCQCTAENGNTTQAASCKVRSISTTGFSISISNGNTLPGFANLPFYMSCARSTDYNKSATIIGKFENINSSELVKVEASGNAGQAITANVTNIPFATETIDNYNAWNGSTFTAPKSSFYFFNGAVQLSSAVSNPVFSLYINGNFIKRCSVTNGTVVTDINFSCTHTLAKDEIASFRLNLGGAVVNTASRHFISITELPDTESIIKNLSTQKTKCQTKYLSANVTATGVMSSLTFNNLTLGKKYQVTGQFDIIRNNISANNKNIEISSNHNSSVIWSDIERNFGATEWITSMNPNFKFTASASSLNFEVLAITEMIVVSPVARTFIELCELPDTYVETDEW